MEPPNHKKSKKHQHEDRGSPDLDRLSSLPDSIMAHVISFLDTRSAVRTSVLSRRYRFIWTLSTSLDFTFPGYQSDRFESYEGRKLFPVKKPSLASFKSYVNRVLQLREHTNLVEFRLSLHEEVTSEFMVSCIKYAARHKVQHLNLRGFVKQNPVALPEILINSSFLISLHLCNATANSIQLPKSVHLPGLKLLRLKKFEFCDTNFNGEVFTGCPNLESLLLGKCSIRPGGKLRVLDVRCLNLKSLEIRWWRSPWIYFNEFAINVWAPLLGFFSFKGHLARVNFEGGLPCVSEARVDLCCPTACSMIDAGERKRRNLNGLLDMLRNICNVKSLSLSLRTFEVMTTLPNLQGRGLIIFENLRLVKLTARNKCTELKMTGKNSSKAKKGITNIAIPAHVLHFILQRSPSLELVSIDLPKESPV